MEPVKEVLIILAFKTLLIFPAFGTQIKGTVTDENGNPLPGANVVVHELQKGTHSDADGGFLISGLKPGTYHIHITHVGFEAVSQFVRVDQGVREINIQMHATMLDLQSLMIEAYPFKSGPTEQSQTVLIVDREFVERYNAGTFANTLERLPGMATINTGVGISKPVIRGMSFNRIMVNDRGIKQEGQQWGADHGLEIDPFDVDRVEIIKGPASLIYGSDGMAGVINIKPAPLPEAPGVRGDWINSFRTNNNLLASSLRLEGRHKDFVFRARVTAQEFGDYKVPADEFIYATRRLPIFDNRLKNTAGKERHFSLMTGLRKSWGHTTITVSRFGQEAGLFRGAVGIPSRGDLRHDGSHRNIDLPYQNNEHWKVISNTNILLGNNWLEVDLGFQSNNREEHSWPHIHGIVGERPEGTLAMGWRLNTYTGNIRYHISDSERNQGILGAQLQGMENSHRGFEFLLPQFETYQAGIFYFHEYKLNHDLVINAGIRADGAQHRIYEHIMPDFYNENPGNDFMQRNPDIERDYFNFSGSLGLSWVYKHRFNAKLNLGSSFRIPTAIELASNGVHHGAFRHVVGNPELISERGYQADLNLSYKSKSFFVSLTPFLGIFDGYIYLAPSPRFSPMTGSSTIWEYRQNDAVFTGGEIRTEWNPFKGFKWTMGVEYVWNYNIDTRLPLPLTTPFSVLNNLEYRFPMVKGTFEDLFLFVQWRSTGAQNRVDRNELATPGYNLLEAGIGSKIDVFNHPIQIMISGQNLTNEMYFNHLSRYRLINLPEQGRNFSFSLKIPF